MTAATAAAVPVAQKSVSYKTPIALGAFAVLAILLFVVFARNGVSTFSFAQDGTIAIPDVRFPVRGTGTVVAVLAVLLALASTLLVRLRGATSRWIIVLFALLLVVGFLVWATAGQRLPIIGLLTGSLALAAPLIFGALGGVVSERVGVVNIAIEGQLLAGSFVSAVLASVTQNLLVGLIGAVVAGTLVSFVLAALSIKYVVNQVIVGVVLNVLVLGLTTFLYQAVLIPSTDALNSPPTFSNLPIPGLSAIPIVGAVLFDQSIVTYLMIIAVIAVWVGLTRTRWGLRLRAVGEHPQAADTVGINVSRTRFWNVALAGAIVGLGGAYFTLGSVGAFSQNITSGAGYIALAAVIFGRWDPVRASMAGLLFGFASQVANILGIVGSPVPSDILLTLPYVVTIIAVAGLVGRVRGPAAAGRPYVKG
jgi:general nucleoside transport system permease protein